MPIYSKGEFAKLCGKESRWLSIYISRSKVVLTADGKLDGDNLQNKDFIKRHTGSGAEVVSPPYEKIKATKKVKVNPGVNEKKTQPVNEDTGLYDLDKIKKQKEIEKVTEEIELLKIKKEKQHAIVLPTVLIKSLFSQHTKSILVEFNNSVDGIITRIAKRKALGNDEVAAIRQEVFGDINKAVDAAMDLTQKEIKNIARQFAEKRGVGEK